MNLWNLLAEETEGNPWGSYILMGILLVVIVVFMVMNRRTQAKRQEETMNMLNAIKPGNKVKTIGGICGVVVEVCNEDNTFVMETGSENNKSYIKFDKQAVYQTDATADKAEVKKEVVAETPVEEEAPFEEVQETVAEAEVEMVDVAEETTEE